MTGRRLSHCGMPASDEDGLVVDSIGDGSVGDDMLRLHMDASDDEELGGSATEDDDVVSSTDDAFLGGGILKVYLPMTLSAHPSRACNSCMDECRRDAPTLLLTTSRIVTPAPVGPSAMPAPTTRRPVEIHSSRDDSGTNGIGATADKCTCRRIIRYRWNDLAKDCAIRRGLNPSILQH